MAIQVGFKTHFFLFKICLVCYNLSMAKVKSKWVCQNCGYETVSYLGRCPECNQFGTFVEEVTTSIKIESSKPSNQLTGESKISKIKEIELDEKIRFRTNIEELNRVLGGGFVQGSLSLLAGDP
jgi:DNA repair protein RadA/Sms